MALYMMSYEDKEEHEINSKMSFLYKMVKKPQI
jgi:hypothetical protein